MNIVLFSHPFFLRHLSMRRYMNLLSVGLIKKGHKVENWFPKTILFKIPLPLALRKWLGYIDQYIIFPVTIINRIRKCSDDTLFVFTDNSLGPWMPLVANRKHVIHCHDFLAQRSAMGEILENPVSWTGKKYQAYIRRGLIKGKNFISVSQKTREDLHGILPFKPLLSEVVYNGLSESFMPLEYTEVRRRLGREINIDLSSGYILHVGGNQWYKNRSGVIAIYNTWRATYNNKLPLLMVGEAPDPDLLNDTEKTFFKDSIHFLTSLEDESVHLCYAGASVFLFPSLEEGFGWPIVEAMASGCPVITTRQAPITEVGGEAACYISRQPSDQKYLPNWETEGSEMMEKVIKLSPAERKKLVESGLLNAKKFDADISLDKIESIYKSVFNSYINS